MDTVTAEAPADFDNYGSHLPILELILDNCRIQSVIEHGCGLHSTALFASRCPHVLAIDNNPEWRGKVEQAIGKPQHVKIVNGSKLLRFTAGGCDLAFIDGCTDGRLPSLQAALDARVPIIVMHNFERTGTYRWNRAVVPGAYRLVRFKSLHGRGSVTGVYYLPPPEINTWTVRDHKRL